MTDKLLLEATYYMTENNLSMAKQSTKDAMKILFENNKIYDPKMISAYNIAIVVSLTQGDIEKAKNFLDKALSIQSIIKRPHDALIPLYYIAAKIEEVEKKYTKSIDYYKKTLQLIKELKRTKNYIDIQKESLYAIETLSPFAKKEIVYKEFSFLDFLNKIKKNAPNISIQQYINKNLEHSECIQLLCKKLSYEYLKTDGIYTEYLKNPSQVENNIFNFYKITNFNYLFNTMVVCALLKKDVSFRNTVLSKLNNDLFSIMKHSTSPMELDIIVSNYQDFYKILKKLNIFSSFFKSNQYFSKIIFFKKLQEYKEIQLKEQDPKLVGDIPENKKKVLYKRYEYFQKYFQKYFSDMISVIKSNDNDRWEKYITNLTSIIKNRDTIINKNGEKGRAKVWAGRVMLYFKNIFDNYQELFNKSIKDKKGVSLK
jgi:tetratricopeptide (TPR) repeat protein